MQIILDVSVDFYLAPTCADTVNFVAAKKQFKGKPDASQRRTPGAGKRVA
jgi:hypothetical protein